MEGVTILSTDTSLFWWQIIWLIVDVGYLIYFICYVLTELEFMGNYKIKKLILRLAILVALFSGFLFSMKLYPYAEYQVFLSDDVKMSEFLEKYEIIEQNGQSLTVKIKGE